MKRAEITKSLNHAHLRGRVTVTIWVPVEAALDWREKGTLVALEKETFTTVKFAVGDIRGGGGGGVGIGIGGGGGVGIGIGGGGGVGIGIGGGGGGGVGIGIGGGGGVGGVGIGIGGESKEESKSLWSPIAIRGDPFQVYVAYQRISNMTEGELDDVVVAFPIHPRYIDKLVGVHGERIKSVSADTGVRIYAPTHVPAVGGGAVKTLPLKVGVFPKNHVQLEGKAENVFTALALFVKAVLGAKVIIHDIDGGAEGRGGVDNARGESGGSSSSSTKHVPHKQMADQITTTRAPSSPTLTTPMPEVQTERILKLAGGNLGILVGSKGKTTSVLRSIMKFAMVNLSTKISSRIAPAAKSGEVTTAMDVELTLKGPENCVELASDAILSLLKGEPINDVMVRMKQTGGKQGYSHPPGGGSGRGGNTRNMGSGGGKGRGRGGGRGGSGTRLLKGGKENVIGHGQTAAT